MTGRMRVASSRARVCLVDGRCERGFIHDPLFDTYFYIDACVLCPPGRFGLETPHWKFVFYFCGLMRNSLVLGDEGMG
jgi:hypothetical protein